VGDEWELGTPTVGPAAARSGLRCWGTDLDGSYENGADSWLLSPSFSLDGLADASLSFWLYLRVQDEINGPVNDPLWVEITSDGTDFTPVSTTLAGGNDDPAIPDVGGWARVVLDLSRHLGPDPVRLRFRFTSDGDVVQAGAYLDDVEVTGRPVGSGVAPRRPTSRTAPGAVPAEP
jgi:bacillopeptidase F